ncbi:hypothetical protein KI387_019154, partial [Taxus chinensis]
MAGNPRFEISSNSPDGSNFTGYNGQRSHFSSASNLERSSSFRENIESRILTAGGNFPRGSTSLHGEHLPLSQVLLLDTLSMGDQKRQADLKKVTNSALGIVTEDPSLGPVQVKPLSSLGVEELKRVRMSVTENSVKARERAKFLNDAICKLDKYRSPMLPRKRSRTELSTSSPFDRSALGGNLLKAGPQNHTASNSTDLISQRPDDRKSTVPNKRVRTSLMDMRMEGRPNNLPRPSIMTDRERDMLRSGNAASQLEDKDRTLPAGSEGWEKTKLKGRRSGMKPDVSLNAVANRTLEGDRDYKRGIQQRPTTESRSRPSEGHGFRSGPVHGIVSMHKMENSSQPSGLNVRAMTRNESDSAIPANEKRDRFVCSEKDRAILKSSIKSNVRDENRVASPTTITKGKPSRAPRSGSGASANSSPNISRTSPTFDGWERTSNANRGQITAPSNSRKRPFPTGSSSVPVAQWAEQKPPKNQRTKRTNLVPPVSNRDDVTSLVEGSSNPDSGAKPDSTESNGQGFLRRSSNNTTIQQSRLKTEVVSSLAAFSESEESGAGDKCKDKNKKQGDTEEKIAPVSQKVGSLVLPPKKTKTVVKEESGDGVRRQGRSGRASTPLRVNVPPSGKLENVGTEKQLRSTRPGTDKMESKTGRPPTKKTSLDRKPVTRPRRPMNSGLPDFTGESDDDREELLAAVNAAINASDVACSGDFWKYMEPFFAFLTQDDLIFLKQQISEVEDVDTAVACPSGGNQNGKADLLCSTLPAASSPIILSKQRSLANGCVDIESLRPSSSLNAREDSERSSGKFRWLDKMLPLSQRLLSALIVEEEDEEANRILYDGSQDDCVRYTSEDSPYANCNQIGNETQSAGKVEPEIEPEVELKNWKHQMLDCSHYDHSFVNGHRNHITENIYSDDYRQGDIIVHSEILSFNAEFRGLDERHTHGGQRNQDELQSNCQTFGLISGIAAYDIQYQEMSLDQKILLELQSIGLFPESVPDLSQREDEEIKEDICKLKEELRQQVSKNKGHVHKLEKAVFKRREDEEREREILAMNKLVELAYNRHMGTRGTNASGAKSAGNKLTKQATLGFVKRTLAKCQMFKETGKSCFSEPPLKERIFSISSRETDKKLLGDAVEGDTANALIENAPALLDIKTSANPAIPSEHTARIVAHHTQKLENGDRELCNTVQGTATYTEQTVVKDEMWSTRVKKRELLLEEVRVAPALGTTLLGGAKGKRTERDREGKGQTKEILTRSGTARSGRPGLGNAKGERKNKPKPKQKTAQLSAAANGLLGKPAEAPKSSLTSNYCEKASDKMVKVKDELPASQNSVADDDGSHNNEGAIDLSHLQLPGMEDFVVNDDIGGQGQDLGSWLSFEDDALPDAAGDLMGLAVPMDDLADLKISQRFLRWNVYICSDQHVTLNQAINLYAFEQKYLISVHISMGSIINM